METPEIIWGSPQLLACYAGWLIADLERAGVRAFRARIVNALVTDKLNLTFMLRLETDVANYWREHRASSPPPSLEAFLNQMPRARRRIKLV